MDVNGNDWIMILFDPYNILTYPTIIYNTFQWTLLRLITSTYANMIQHAPALIWARHCKTMIHETRWNILSYPEHDLIWHQLKLYNINLIKSLQTGQPQRHYASRNSRRRYRRLRRGRGCATAGVCGVHLILGHKRAYVKNRLKMIENALICPTMSYLVLVPHQDVPNCANCFCMFLSYSVMFLNAPEYSWILCRTRKQTKYNKINQNKQDIRKHKKTLKININKQTQSNTDKIK